MENTEEQPKPEEAKTRSTEEEEILLQGENPAQQDMEMDEAAILDDNTMETDETTHQITINEKQTNKTTYTPYTPRKQTNPFPTEETLQRVYSSTGSIYKIITSNAPQVAMKLKNNDPFPILVALKRQANCPPPIGTLVRIYDAVEDNKGKKHSIFEGSLIPINGYIRPGFQSATWVILRQPHTRTVIGLVAGRINNSKVQ